MYMANCKSRNETEKAKEIREGKLNRRENEGAWKKRAMGKSENESGESALWRCVAAFSYKMGKATT